MVRAFLAFDAWSGNQGDLSARWLHGNPCDVSHWPRSAYRWFYGFLLETPLIPPWDSPAFGSGGSWLDCKPKLWSKSRRDVAVWYDFPASILPYLYHKAISSDLLNSLVLLPVQSWNSPVPWDDESDASLLLPWLKAASHSTFCGYLF